MDLQTYAVQKYAMALAIAIVKSKPPDESINDYVEKLRSKLIENQEIITEDIFDSEINEDDFDCVNNTNITVAHNKAEEKRFSAIKDIVLNEKTDLICCKNEKTDVICCKNDKIHEKSNPKHTDVFKTSEIEINTELTVSDISEIASERYQHNIAEKIKNFFTKTTDNVIDKASNDQNKVIDFHNGGPEINQLDKVIDFQNGGPEMMYEANGIDNFCNEENMVDSWNSSVEEEKSRYVNKQGIAQSNETQEVVENFAPILDTNASNDNTLIQQSQLLFEQDMDLDTQEIQQENKKFKTNEDNLDFKVLYGLDFVKKYLTRNVRCHEDSGFKESSQSSARNCGSQKETQTDYRILEDSGRALMTYIANCHFEILTNDLTKEISDSLSALVDSLHEGEKHMTFMEDLLDFDRELVEKLANSQDISVKAFMLKQEYSMKVILLNKSRNLSEYTIKLLINKLNAFYETLMDDTESPYENMDQIDSIFYVIDLLKNIISNLAAMKNSKENDTEQMELGSDEETELTCSNKLVNLWRSKWVTSETLKVPQIVGKKEKFDVFQVCCDVLTKFIVNCTEKFALISFSALQCYNMLQTKK